MGHLARLVAGVIVVMPGLMLAPLAMAQRDEDADALNTQIIKL